MQSNPLGEHASRIDAVVKFFQKMKQSDVEKERTATLKALDSIEASVEVLRKLFAAAEKSTTACPYCPKSLVNLKAHIQNIHTCVSCENANIRNMYEHQNGCEKYIQKLTADAKALGLTYIHSEREIYKVKDGNAYEFDVAADTKGDYVGRIRADGTLDRDAKEVEKALMQCPYCEKQFLALGSHIFNKHTCVFCNDATIRYMDAHLYLCSAHKEFSSKSEAERIAEREKRFGVPVGGPAPIKKEAPETAVPVKKEAPAPAPAPEPVVPVKKESKKERIPAQLKTIVWSKYIGSSIPEAKCYCCKHEQIEIRSFECGHVVAEAKGGKLTLDNLRPICRGCNSSMGTMSMEEFAQKFFGWSVLREPAAAETSGDPVASAVKEDIFDIFAAPITQTVVHVPVKKEDPFADLLG
jgi:hypothetical protein